MKNPYYHAPLALMCISLLIAPAVSAERVPGLPFDPVAYQQRVEEGPDIVPLEVVHSPAELKMGSQLASLFNADLRPPGVTVEDLKEEMLRLGQIRGGDGSPEQLRVYLHLADAAAAAVVLPILLEPSVPGDHWPMDEWPMLAGWILETDLEAVALMPEVVFIQAVDPPRFRSGSAVTEGDALHHGPQARGAPYLLDGNGITVGVISDGVSNLATAQGTNDLPPAVVVLAPPGSGDEGTAMLEIIHDMAPAAQLAFAASGGNIIAFGNAITGLHQHGCDIICDDVGWYTDPFFEHSPLGSMIGNLQSMRDYLHVSAAGNDAELHHQQIFTDSNSDGWHDPFLMIDIPPAGKLDVFMQWKEFLNSTPQSDYDLYLYDWDTVNDTLTLVASSLTRNRVGETIYYTNNTTSNVLAVLYVYKLSGAINHEIEIFIEPQNGAVQYTNSTSPVDAIFGHPGFGTVFSVVATEWDDPTQIEWFSSQGPFTIIAHPQFQPKKPDFAGADGVTVSGAGGFASPFFGTSAAAPHVAGVLALAWSRDPGAQAAEFRNPFVLSQATVDLGTAGFDPVFGWGRLQADLLAGQFNEAPVVGLASGVIQCVQHQWQELGGLVDVSDPDAGASPIVVTFTASRGDVALAVGVPGGLTPGEIQFNGTMQVVVTAAQGAIQATLDAPDGLRYRPHPVPPGPPVAESLQISANDQGHTGIGSALTASAWLDLLNHQNRYEAWRHVHFDAMQLLDPTVSGDDANPDGDMFSNQWEFFIGGNPWLPDGETTPSFGFESGQFVMRFRMSRDIPAHAFEIKSSTDLVNWTVVRPHDVTDPWPDHPAVPDAWLMEVTRPPGPGGREFLRIEFDPRH